eukprot:CAMPEP_0194478956 /NCGR_PEP_ID=MMETSP0253-20130528/2233_1 /TAXON_ID=2966 /ORGANISM="Noctiluca scintillans" /LENGTH=145 /DNA_ID=CAMNT_0039318117 /DNA_START=301 /DNA_END=738 /DNA_ORIENTATION=+
MATSKIGRPRIASRLSHTASVVQQSTCPDGIPCVGVPSEWRFADSGGRGCWQKGFITNSDTTPEMTINTRQCTPTNQSCSTHRTTPRTTRGNKKGKKLKKSAARLMKLQSKGQATETWSTASFAGPLPQSPNSGSYVLAVDWASK